MNLYCICAQICQTQLPRTCVSRLSTLNKIVIVAAYPQRGLLNRRTSRLVFFDIKTVIRLPAADSSVSRTANRAQKVIDVVGRGIATCKPLRSIDYNVTITSSMGPYGDLAIDFGDEWRIPIQKRQSLLRETNRVRIPSFVAFRSRMSRREKRRW